MNKFINLSTKLILGTLSMVGFFSLAYLATIDKGHLDLGVITFKLVNDSGKTIDHAKIMLSDRECSGSNINTTGNLKCWFGQMDDNSFQVSITLEDGTQIEDSNFGYVTTGTDYMHVATLTKEYKLKLVFEGLLLSESPKTATKPPVI
jgi:hypothetical protein